jgi:hypothetical protein
VPFEASDTNLDWAVRTEFAEHITRRLLLDFGPLFDQVRQGTSDGGAHGLLVTGLIRTYNRGDSTVRYLGGPGMGGASLKGDLILKDGKDNHIIYQASFDKLWAWGGILGAYKNIDDMQKEVEAAIANTIARGKGWNPGKQN